MSAPPSPHVTLQRLKEREAQFRAIFDASPIPQALMAEDSRDFLMVNDALCRLVGHPRGDLVGASARTVTFPDDIAVIERARDLAEADPAGQHRVERRMVHASGDIVFTDTTLTWIKLPGGARMLLQQITDITAQRRAEQGLLRQSETDSLTGMPNRLRLLRELTALDNTQQFAVLFLDIDRFKVINDTRGHDVADEILVEVAHRLQAFEHPQVTIARFGGDEFALLCRGDDDGNGPTGLRLAECVRDFADRIQESLSQPIDTSTGPTRITVSIGICDDTIPVQRPLERLQRADTAAYQAKRQGEDRQVIYDLRLHRATTEYRRMESLLRTALEEERFDVHYQPIVDLADGRAVGFEALVRMRDLDGRLVPPGEFIDVAEKSGLIVPMGAWVLAEACRTIARLHREHGVPARVSVNVAARQAARRGLIDVVTDALDGAALTPRALTLELTESALLEADHDTLGRLMQLRERGVEIALDDFGTGYSSLTYLRQLPLTRLKVDRSFVGTMTSDPGSAAIVRAVTTLARDLGLSWVAEGVETEAQWRALQALGPGMAQGYYFWRPQPADRLAATGCFRVG